MELARDLQRYRRGFPQMRVCFDETDRIGSLCLPLICREVLEDELDEELNFDAPGLRSIRTVGDGFAGGGVSQARA